jgi:hypothetical protein
MKMVIMMLGITARIPIADSIDGERVTYHPHSARHGGAGRAGGPTPCVCWCLLIFVHRGPSADTSGHIMLFRPRAPQTTRSRHSPSEMPGRPNQFKSAAQCSNAHGSIAGLHRARVRTINLMEKLREKA